MLTVIKPQESGEPRRSVSKSVRSWFSHKTVPSAKQAPIVKIPERTASPPHPFLLSSKDSVLTASDTNAHSVPAIYVTKPELIEKTSLVPNPTSNTSSGTPSLSSEEPLPSSPPKARSSSRLGGVLLDSTKNALKILEATLGLAPVPGLDAIPKCLTVVLEMYEVCDIRPLLLLLLLSRDCVLNRSDVGATVHFRSESPRR